jgi:cbb3-type cytochrome oxidase maturation protein
MFLAAIIILIVMGIGATSAIGAFFWAAKSKQFENVEEGSHVIFDADEPIGMPTDSFPGSSRKSTNKPSSQNSNETSS